MRDDSKFCSNSVVILDHPDRPDTLPTSSPCPPSTLTAYDSERGIRGSMMASEPYVEATELPGSALKAQNPTGQSDLTVESSTSLWRWGRVAVLLVSGITLFAFASARVIPSSVPPPAQAGPLLVTPAVADLGKQPWGKSSVSFVVKNPLNEQLTIAVVNSACTCTSVLSNGLPLKGKVIPPGSSLPISFNWDTTGPTGVVRTGVTLELQGERGQPVGSTYLSAIADVVPDFSFSPSTVRIRPKGKRQRLVLENNAATPYVVTRLIPGNRAIRVVPGSGPSEWHIELNESRLDSPLVSSTILAFTSHPVVSEVRIPVVVERE